MPSPSENLDHPISAAADNPPSVLAPHDRTNTFSAHEAVAGDFLRAAPLLERPEAKAGVMASGDEFAAVGGKGEGGDGGGVSEHIVCTLT